MTIEGDGFGANHLLTIGRDTAVSEEVVRLGAVRLQVVDVRDPSGPKLAQVELIGQTSSSSEALTNHLAFQYFEPKRLLLLPIDVSDDAPAANGLFRGLVVYAMPAWMGACVCGGQ